MCEVILFGGTAEGRALCQLLCEKGVEALVCVATGYGEALLPASDTLRVHTGRLNQQAMEALLELEKARVVIDATHPYALEVGGNIRTACEIAGIKRIRLLREPLVSDGSHAFSNMAEIIGWLNARQGTIFSALGAKEAAALTSVADYKERIWLRILPDVAGLSACLEAGYPAKHIICMQGPFSQELNSAMFRAAGADILLTKESGAVGGYREKREAARECGMVVATLARPATEGGLTFADLVNLIKGGVL